MINHIRTLILDELDTVAGLESGTAYCEAIDTSFAPIPLPPSLLPIKNTLFTTDLTVSSKNFLMKQLMPLLHSPEFIDYTLKFDSRYTYDTDEQFKFTNIVKLDKFNSHDSYTDITYKLATTLPYNLQDTSFTLANDDDTHVTVTSNNTSITRPIGFARGSTSYFTLLPNLLSVKFIDSANRFTGKFNFKLQLTPPYKVNIQQYFNNILTVSESPSTYVTLFKSGNYPEEDSLNSIFTNNSGDVARFTAVMLAYAYQYEYTRKLAYGRG